MVSMSPIRGKGLEYQIKCMDETLRRLKATGRIKEYEQLLPIVRCYKKEHKRRSKIVTDRNPAIEKLKPVVNHTPQQKPLDVTLKKNDVTDKVLAVFDAGITSYRKISAELNNEVNHVRVMRILRRAGRV